MIIRHLGSCSHWEMALSRVRMIVVVLAGTAGAVWVSSCGDGAVAPPPPPPAPVATTVTVSPASATLSALEETTRFTAEVRDQNGQVMAGASVAWTSSDAAVAVVDASGQVTAAANGNATITATAGSVSGTAAVTVGQVVRAISVSPAVDTLVALGDTVRLVAEAADANGHAVAAVTEFEWSSSDTLVARVDDSGLVESLAEGEAVVTATASEVTGAADLTVVPPLPTTVAVSPDTVRFTALGQTAQLAAEVREQAGRAMAEAMVSWSSGDTLVAAVDSAGLLTAVGAGTTTVTAAAGGVSGDVVVSVMQSAGSVVVSPSEGTIGVGDTLRLTAEAFDENGHAVDGAVFSWSSSDAGVARVDESGLVEAVAEGTARITAAAGDVSGVAEITVENPDRAALVALYEATDGPNWIDSENWLTDAPLEEWYGVETVREVLGRETDVSGRVWRLRIPDNALAGEIPPESGNLSELRTLDLGGNELTGAIPPELGSLAKLNWLELGNNNLTGSIPSELGDLSALQQLWLQDNGLTGPIPPELGNLSQLTWLWMGANELTGSIPPELGNLSRLVTLGLSPNELTGSIPPELGNLTELKSLSFSGNPLTGVVPRSFLQLNKLDSFSCRRTEGLCAPATDEFRAWALEVQTRGAFDLALNVPFCDEPDRSALESLFEAARGSVWAQSSGWLEDENLAMWHGVRTDSIGRVSSLDLSGNGLSGFVPDALGMLAHLKALRIGNNELVGRLPVSLANVPLEELDYRGTTLCAPDDARFGGWLNGIPRHFGTGVQCPPLTDRDILTSLYWNSDGPNWRWSSRWLTEAPLSAWHGVTTDDAGRVVSLSLRRNGMSGTLPPAIGQLTELEVLSLALNGLSGEIPAELGNLSQLRTMDLVGNSLSGSIPADFGDLDRLESLSLSGNQLSGEIPAALGQMSELRQLYLSSNALGGPIPPELGQLSELRHLYLRDNMLGGPIPPELGDLGRLERLYLSRNRLTDAIPAEVGDLTVLEELDFRSNRLSGRIPPALGSLDELRYLALFDNQLTGPIPPELGGLAKLDTLNLHDNQLSGPLPPELGRAAKLQGLNLQSNRLTGPIPSEFADLALLKQLILADNPGLAGPLPVDITALGQLEQLMTGGTGLCRPTEARFDAWFRTIAERWVVPCERGAAVYLTQTVQSWDDPVSLLGGKSALLRVFVTAPQGSSATMPDVRATFYLDGAERHTVRIPASTQTIPTYFTEDDLALSANAEIPGDVIAPGLEMVIEVDPDGTLDPALGVTKRVPDSGRMQVDVRALPPLQLTLIPFLTEGDPDSSAVDTVASMAADPNGGHEMLRDVRTILPVGELVVTAHDPVTTSYRHVGRRLAQVEAMRLMEGGTGHWMGMFAQPRSHTTFPSVAKLGGRETMVTVTGVGIVRVLAHELGHNLGLRHAPCGTNVSGLDPWFPHRGGRIGAWGYDPERSALLDPKAYDLMSYCWGNHWISDYFYNKAFDHRVSEAAAESAAAGPVRSLLVWGGRDEDGVAYLDPAFVVDAVPSLPAAGGEYTIEGVTADGTPLFSSAFDMTVIEDAEGVETNFVFTLPVEDGWADGLASIKLSGPGGSATLDESTNRPMAILRDPQTGQVRAFLSDLPPAAETAADAVGQVSGAGHGMEVLFSRGIPGRTAWQQ